MWRAGDLGQGEVGVDLRLDNLGDDVAHHGGLLFGIDRAERPVDLAGAGVEGLALLIPGALVRGGRLGLPQPLLPEG